MKELRYTLLPDGSSDRVLLHIISWTLRQQLPETAIQAEFADLRRLPKVPKPLEEKIQRSIELFPCNILFIHRDAERETRAHRIAEIDKAIAKIKDFSMPVVRIIPVRMSEAWLLFDEQAIRTAASNPSGRQRLDLPKPASVEALPDPKETLYELLRTASPAKGRKAKQLQINALVHRVAELIDDYSPLRQLESFAALEEEIQHVLARLAMFQEED